MTEGGPQFSGRVCWNSDQWHHPTGDAKDAETGSYASETGFGHEEWCFNEDWVLEGYKYAYLQPFRNTTKVSPGDVVDILCFSFAPDRRGYYIARVRRCELLTPEQMETAIASYRRNGWLREMQTDVASIGGDQSVFTEVVPKEVLNVRFRLEDAELFDPPIEMPPVDYEFYRTHHRYLLYNAPPSQFAGLAPETSSGSDEPRNTDPVERQGVPPTIASRAEARLQNALHKVLKAKYPQAAVRMERFRTDLALLGESGRILIEVKVRTGAYDAIRSAIGQILDYSHQATVRGERLQALYIVSPAPASSGSDAFLTYVNDGRTIPVRYVQFTELSTTVAI